MEVDKAEQTTPKNADSDIEEKERDSTAVENEIPIYDDSNSSKAQIHILTQATESDKSHKATATAENSNILMDQGDAIISDDSEASGIVPAVYDNSITEPISAESSAKGGCGDISLNIDLNLPTASAGVLMDTSTTASDAYVENRSDIHQIKWIDWSDDKSPIVTQNENGPCPLLAIFNVLLLSKRITLGEGAEFISSSQIMSRVAEIIWDAMPQSLNDDERLNYEQNISDAIGVFPNLQTGLDVNIKFDGVRSFEYTPELAVFDLFRIPLYHGWLVDPQDVTTANILHGLSYNQAVEKVITSTSSENSDDVQKGLIAKEFLESTASQITYHGIASLRDEMQPGSLAVLFRNNHFCTIHRHNDELFTLITDLGFLKERNVVWESLSSIQGDSQFVDGRFLNSPPKPLTDSTRDSPPNTDLDYQLALSMQQELGAPSQQVYAPQEQDDSADFLLAQRLQERENAQASRNPRPSGQSSRQQVSNDQPQRVDGRGRDCAIL